MIAFKRFKNYSNQKMGEYAKSRWENSLAGVKEQIEGIKRALGIHTIQSDMEAYMELIYNFVSKQDERLNERKKELQQKLSKFF